MNQGVGHEIKQLGSPNDNGYFKTFYIEAPGRFDKVCGKYEVSQPQIDALNAYNDGITWNTHTATNGSIMNNSLQNTICMQLSTVASDARLINQQIV